MVGQSRRPPARAALDAGALATHWIAGLQARSRSDAGLEARGPLEVASFIDGCDGAADMIRRLFSFVLALSTLAAPAFAKDELVLGMTQSPGTWNPLISSMLAKSLISNMTARPLTAYDANSNLVCLVCTELPTIENGKARVIDLPDDGKGGGKKGMEVDVEMRDMRWGDGVPVTAKDVAFTLEVGKHPLSGVASSEGYKRILKLDIKDDRHFTMTIDRVTFDYNSIGISIVPAHIEKPIFDANPAEYRNKTAYDTDSTNPGLAFGPYRIVEVVPGSRIALEQNSSWTGEKPHFKRIVVKIIENTAALEANLLSGNVDYVLGELGLSLDQALAFEKRHKDKYDFIYKPALIYEHIDINARQPAAGRPPRAPGDPDGDRPQGDLRQAVRGQAAGRRRPDQPARPDVQPGGAALRLRSGGGAQAAGRGGLRRDQERRAPERQGRALVDRDHDHRRQSRARAGGAGDPEPAAPGRHRAAHQGRAAAHLLGGAEPAAVHRACHVCLGAAARGRAALDPAFGGDPVGRRTAGAARTIRATRIPTWTRRSTPPSASSIEAKRRALFADIQRIHADDLPVLPLFFRVDPFVIPKPLKGVVPTGHLNSSTLWIEQWRWEN